MYAWGETEPKDNYDWPTYKWCNGDGSNLTKYCTESSYWDRNSSAPMDNRTVLDLEDDAAYVNLGGSWRMPTYAEWCEIRDKCTWTWTDNYNGLGVSGRVVASSNGNSIFLPAAGGQFDTRRNSIGSDGYYWSSSLDYPSNAFIVCFNSYDVSVFHGGRWDRPCGVFVRPVTE